MDLRNFLKENNGLYFLKWVKIIQQESEAIKPSSLYILELDQKFCEIIFIDDNGNKRKSSGISKETFAEDFAKLDLSNLDEETRSLWIDILGGLSAYDVAVERGFSGSVEEWLISLKGEKGDSGESAVLTFNVNNNMHLIMQQEITNEIEFTLDSNGHLILNT